MEPFIVNSDIIDLKKLYGRDKIVKTLISCLQRRENAGIIGARRFGKTCILKSMEAYISEHKEYNAIPVYFDVKSQTNIHKNTSEVYFNIAAILAKHMFELGILEEGEFKISRRCKLDVSDDVLDMKMQMSSWHSEYQQQALFSLSEKVCEHGKFVLLLLDEIDSFLLDALTVPSDFGRIRGAALDSSRKLKIWVAGTAPWKAITTNIGSPELNCGLEAITLTKLEKEDYNSMWEAECCLVQDESRRKTLLSFKDAIYEKTGGIPYYAKYIGSSFVNGTITALPDYTILRDYICEIYESAFMTNEERSVLSILENNGQTFSETLPDDVNALIAKGLVEKQNDKCSIVFGYFTDYIKAKTSNNSIHSPIDIEQKERDILVDEIIRLRDNVNKSYSEAPFLTSSEDPIYFNTLKKQCVDEASLIAFATTLCKLYYEGSNNGTRLPGCFFTNNLSKIIRALRNKCDHRDCEARVLADSELYLHINGGIKPFEKNHFVNIQNNILKMFRDELVLMGNATKESIQQKKEPKFSNFLEENKEYEGVIISVSNTHGTFLNVKCIQHAYPLQIIHKRENIQENDKVLFKAIKEPNKNDPTKSFWKADDIRLIK